jgi:hypothetical protein
VTPFLHFDKDNKDSTIKLTVFKKRQPGGMYKYNVIGSSQSIDIDKTQFKERDDELRKLVLGGKV